MRFIIFFSCVFLVACNQNKLPEDVLSQTKMEEVFWDYVQADVYAQNFAILDSAQTPEMQNAFLKEEVFKKHNISRETFDKSYNYYVTHEKLMTALMDSITANQQRVPKSKSPSKNLQIDEKTIQ